MWSVLVYTLTCVLNTGNLFLQGFFVVMYGDLEIDYINPIDLCNKLNKYILPEFALQGGTALMLLLTGHWFSFLLNLPLLAYNSMLVYTNQYLLDATEIFKTLNHHKRVSFTKLVFHMLIFFYYLFMMIVSIVGWDEDLTN